MRSCVMILKLTYCFHRGGLSHCRRDNCFQLMPILHFFKKVNDFPSLLATEVYSLGIPEGLGAFHPSSMRKRIFYERGTE